MSNNVGVALFAEDAVTCCGVIFNNLRDLSTHIRTSHDGLSALAVAADGQTSDKASEVESSVANAWTLTPPPTQSISHASTRPHPTRRVTSHSTPHDSTPNSEVRRPSRAYQCSLCDKSFGWSYNLTRHIKNHSQQSYKCNACASSFKRADILTRHMKMFHFISESHSSTSTTMCQLFDDVMRNENASSLKGLRLAIPEAVRSGETVRLACNYDLEGAFLYSIKWYREDEEFYRYLPKEAPPTRVFPLTGVHVDVSTSDDRIVTLLNVDRRSTGTFKCEVSADAPLFHTEIQSAVLRVVDVPVGEPAIMTDKVRYASGEQIQVNCTAPPSHPAANLTWYLNDHQENAELTVVALGGLEQTQSMLSLEADTGKLHLRCEVTMFHLYRGVSELELWQDSPRPASVMGPSQSAASEERSLKTTHLQLYLSLLGFLLLAAR